MRTRLRAAVLDLFGTLVDAPTRHDRHRAACAIAAITEVDTRTAEETLISTWRIRHDGRLPSLDDLAGYLAQCLTGSAETCTDLARLLYVQATNRLRPDQSVVAALRRLRDQGLRIGVLSDASADVASAWPASDLAPLVDGAVFSCTAHAVKPSPRLYAAILDLVGTEPAKTTFCGDGGGDELRGATAAGLAAVRVQRRGGAGTLAFGDRPWSGPRITSIEDLPDLLLSRAGST
ncbi:MAG TPA: HAD family hydrolase [Streptosporangiaceae bacterium]|nr:HAD family hydrolase [Streptosporangiaceae bacterium]